ncbi:RIP metalloprotease RseP [Agrilactobacillus yilanensis]|uniref:Zinc metalloprotease n=1 Tax=Agrilactobacillus yilanensis TaxID=2485997 RepID=A0ABW4JAZ8_9LACO|nr:RIP metalloprotease RseP [Agrilactobacillus yilanensis]
MKTIIVFIIVFGLLVLVHEYGHYYFAKKSGILVREFSIGMGPKLFATRKNGTTYTIRWLPLGGYVRMAGSSDDELEIEAGTMATLVLDDNGKVKKINTSNKVVSTDGIPIQINKTDLEKELYVEGYENGDEQELKRFEVWHDATVIEKDGTEVQIAPIDRQFRSASLPKRMITNFAGPMNNFIFAILIFIVLAFMRGGVPQNTNEVGQIMADSPAAKVGLKTGDKILKVNGQKTADWTAAQTQISKYPGKQITLTVQHNQKTEQLKITPKKVTQQKQTYGQIGIMQSMNTNFGAKIAYGFTAFADLSGQIFYLLGRMVTGHFSIDQLAGPVGIYTMTSQATSQGLNTIIYFLAYLSVNLGIINLIPIPALDGGKLLLNIIEGIRGKPISQDKEAIVTLIGVGLLVFLMIAVTFNDFQRIFTH